MVNFLPLFECETFFTDLLVDDDDDSDDDDHDHNHDV